MDSGQWIYAPLDDTKEFGRQLVADLRKRWRPPKNFFHLRAGGHVAAMSSHLDSEVFVHLDIKDFFGAISKNRVTRHLSPFFGYEAARQVAQASTVVNPDAKGSSLPFGFVQSPLLASLCLASSALGSVIADWDSKDGVVVSVYMDDIIFSAKNWETAAACKADAEAAAARAKLSLNAQKSEGPADSITAFNINLSQHDMRVTGDRFSQFVHVMSHESREDVANGILGYVSSVNRAQAQKLSEIREASFARAPGKNEGASGS